MIHSALKFLTQEINTYLSNRTGETSRDLALLTSVANASGLIIPNKTIGVSLMNIEEDRISKDQRVSVRNEIGELGNRNPDIYLNLYVLVAANFANAEESDSTDYEEGLKQLSYIISFFQGKNVFTPGNSPGMVAIDSGLGKLVVELFSFTFEQMNNFWSVVGTNYLPSVLYKVKLVTIQENMQLGDQGIVEEIALVPRKMSN